MDKLKWEIIEDSGISKTQRLKVFGGWIVERITIPPASMLTSVTWFHYHQFILDPDHLWGKPELQHSAIEGASQCPECKEVAFMSQEKGGRCLACKIRFCASCGLQLTTEDLIEKCTACGKVNEL